MKNFSAISRSFTRLLMAALFVFPFLAGFANPVFAAHGERGAVFTLSNEASGNSVLVYSRQADGSLTFKDAYPTGGLGTGSGLGSQGAVALSRNGRWLFAVNAGSDQISVLALRPDGKLVLTDVVDSGGSQPVSLTVEESTLYVLNAGGSGNITGFKISKKGHLSPLAGSTQPLSNSGVGAAPAVAQISLSPEGHTLVVTEKSTDLIDTYAVEDGIASAPTTHPSSGPTPFGFAFNKHGYLVVSEAFGGQAGLSALSSYAVEVDEFNLISPSVGTTQTAACWVVISKNGNYAYTTNAGSGSISSYSIGKGGDLTLLDAAAGLTGAGSTPIDMAIDNSGALLYALSAGTHTISAFQVLADGSLAAINTINVPAGAVGLAAR